MKDENKRYTLEERLAMIAASKASSPKSAAAKVKKIAKMPLQGVFSYRDLDVFADLDKEIWDSLTDEVISGYSDFCGYYFTELGRKWKMRSGKSERFGYSVPICNALVALALMLIDRSKKEMNRSARAEIADYLRLTGEDYADELPDLYDKELPLESVREQIFLSNTNYSIPKLRSIAEKTSSRELRERLEAYATPERLDPAADKIRKAVGDLYLLLVEPYLDMQQYHYERHLD